MTHAIDALRMKRMGLKKACREYNVPRSTLQRRYKSSGDNQTAAAKALGSKKKVFDAKLEDELVDHVKAMESMLFGFTPKRFRQLAYQLAEANNIHHRFNMRKKEAGKEWYRAFMSRHQDLSLRMPEATSAARAQGFNSVVVGKFFDLLEELQSKLHFSPDRIFNVDETGITTVPNKPSRVIASKGKKQVGALSSAERGKLVTVEICMSASGNFIPPFFVFPRCRMKADLLDSAPPGSQAVAHPSGWMQSDIFEKWFDHFLQHTHPSAEAPVLLVLDGHKTHTSNLEVINKARQQHVSILCLPPHCSHRLQPLDVTLMKPLSTFYTQEVEKWLLNHPGRAVTVEQLPQLFRDAYLRACSALTAVNGFRKTGIWPINRDVFSEADYAAAVPTDVPLNSDSELATSSSDAAVITVVEPDTCSVQPNESLASTSRHSDETGPVVEQDDITCGSNAPDKETMDVAGYKVHVLDISPLPKATHRSTGKRGRARGRTVVLTSSPYKQELIMKRQETRKVCVPESKKKVAGTNKPKSASTEPTTSHSKKLRQKKVTCRGQKETNRKLSLPREPKKIKSSTAEEYRCIYCNELFVDPPDEDWVQCLSCKDWFHEQCGNDTSVCDICGDS